jgi:TolB protein
MNADGSGVNRISDGTGNDYAPAWAPDDNRLVFVSERDGNGEIYVANMDGTNLTRLTSNGAVDNMPDWTL